MGNTHVAQTYTSIASALAAAKGGETVYVDGVTDEHGIFRAENTTITSVSRSSTVSSVVLAAAPASPIHVGDLIVIYGTTLTSGATTFDGSFRVATVADSTHFTYVQAGAENGSSTGGKISPSFTVYFPSGTGIADTSSATGGRGVLQALSSPDVFNFNVLGSGKLSSEHNHVIYLLGDGKGQVTIDLDAVEAPATSVAAIAVELTEATLSLNVRGDLVFGGGQAFAPSYCRSANCSFGRIIAPAGFCIAPGSHGGFPINFNITAGELLGGTDASDNAAVYLNISGGPDTIYTMNLAVTRYMRGDYGLRYEENDAPKIVIDVTCPLIEGVNGPGVQLQSNDPDDDQDQRLIIHDAKIRSLFNDESGFAINCQSTNILILINCRLVSHATADYCINADSAVTVFAFGEIRANKPRNPNVTLVGEYNFVLDTGLT